MEINLTKVFSWDYKEQPDWGLIGDSIKELQGEGHKVMIYQVPDTGGDDFAIIITNQLDLTHEGVQELYNIIEFDDDVINIFEEVYSICAEIDDKKGITLITDDNEEIIQQMDKKTIDDIVRNKSNHSLVAKIIFDFLELHQK